MTTNVSIAAITPWTLFREFTRMGLAGFGGVLPFVRHNLVVRNRWLNELEFAELLSTGQFLPGPNIVNLAVMFGWRKCGWRGALAAPLGILLLPMCILLLLAMGYQQTQHLSYVKGAVEGMLAVSAGLIIASALKMAMALSPTVGVWVIAAIVFCAVALLQWPLYTVLVVMIPISLFLAWRTLRKTTKANAKDGV